MSKAKLELVLMGIVGVIFGAVALNEGETNIGLILIACGVGCIMVPFVIELVIHGVASLFHSKPPKR